MTAKLPRLTIGKVATQAGLRTSALRYYERVGLLPKPARSAGQRRYLAEVVDRLSLINFAKRAGFRLGEIKQLLGAGQSPKRTAWGASWRRIVPAKLAELEREMARLEEARQRLQALLACHCHRPEQCGRKLRKANV